MEPFVRIIRDNSDFGTGAPLEVYIDGEFVGSVYYNEFKDFDVSNGIHGIYVKMEFLSSSPIRINFVESDNIQIAMQAFLVVLPNLNPISMFMKMISNRNSAIVLRKTFDNRVRE